MSRRAVRAATIAMAMWAFGAVAATAADQPVSGARLKDGRGVVFVSRDPAIAPPAVGGPDDPISNGGWTFALGVDGAVYAMDSGGWTAKPDGTRFKFADHSATTGVRLAVVKAGLLKVKARAGSVPYTPGEAVGIAIDAGETRWCAVFEPGTWVVTSSGKFVGKDAPAPSACPDFGPPASTTSTTSTTVTSTTLLVQCTGGGPFPVCDGTCPAGSVCAPDVDSFALCKCIFDSAPCGETYPVCGGVCDGGGTCRQTGVEPFGSCTCEPPGVLCTDGPYPTCGGACDAGTSCFPVITNVLSLTFPQCQCGNAAPCGSGGLACPPGQSCTNAGGTQLCVPS